MLDHLMPPLHPLCESNARSSPAAPTVATWSAFSTPKCMPHSKRQIQSRPKHGQPDWGSRYFINTCSHKVSSSLFPPQSLIQPGKQIVHVIRPYCYALGSGSESRSWRTSIKGSDVATAWDESGNNGPTDAHCELHSPEGIIIAFRRALRLYSQQLEVSKHGMDSTE